MQAARQDSARLLSDAPRAAVAALLVLGLTPVTFTAIGFLRAGLWLQFSIPVVIAEFLIAACCLIGGLDVAQVLRRTRRTVLAAAFGLILTDALTTLLVASHPADAALRSMFTGVALIFGFCLWGAFSSLWADLRRPALIALAIGIIGHIALGYDLVLSFRHVPNVNWLNFPIGVANVRHLGCYGITLSGMGAGLLATAPDRRTRSLYLLLTMIGFAWTDLSGGRAAFGAGICGAALVWLLAPAETRPRLALELIVAFVAAMPLSMIYIPPNRSWGLQSIFGRLLGQHTVGQFTSGRVRLWKGAWNGFLASPLIGHGEGQFLYEVADGQWDHPHNSILQFLYQWGIVGTSCMLIIVWPALRRARAVAQGHPEFGLPAIGALAGQLLMSLLDGSLYHLFPIMVSIICISALASVEEEGRAVQPSPVLPAP